MPAERFDLTGDFRVRKGEKLEFYVGYKPGGTLVDLSSGYTAKLDVLGKEGDTPLVTLTDTDGLTLANVTVGEVDYNMKVTFSGTKTTSLPSRSVKKYRLEVIPTGADPDGVIEGDLETDWDRTSS